MNVWILSPLSLLFWIPAPEAVTPTFYEAMPDVYIFRSSDGMAMAVVSSDPFSEAAGPTRIWRAELHVRMESRPMSHEVVFRTMAVDKDTLVFRNTGSGVDIRILERRCDPPPDSLVLRRWRFLPDEVREISGVPEAYMEARRRGRNVID